MDGEWFLIVLQWMKKKSVSVLLILSLLLLTLAVQIYLNRREPPSIVIMKQHEKPQEKIIIPEGKKNQDIPIHLSNISREESNINDQKTASSQDSQQRKLNSHPLNFNLALEILKNRVKVEGKDEETAESVMERINSFMGEQHPDYDLKYPILEIIHDPFEAEHYKEWVLEAMTGSYQEAVDRGDIKPD